MPSGASGAAGSASPTSPLPPQASSVESLHLRNFRWSSSIVSIMLVLTGALVFLGWVFGLPVLTSIIEASPDAVVLIDAGGAIRFPNPAAESYLSAAPATSWPQPLFIPKSQGAQMKSPSPAPMEMFALPR
jgi:hypothetical protein